jgi:hypothetical protein
MSNFEFTPYISPNAATLANLLRAPGQDQAEAIQQVGDAQARAAMASADAWASAGRDIGRQVGGVIQQATDPVRKAQIVQANEISDTAKSKQALEAQLKDPSNYKPDGTINDAQVASRLQQQNVGAWQQWTALSAAKQKASLDLLKETTDIAKNNMDVQDKQRALGQAQTDALGRLAYNALGVMQQKPDDPIHARDTFLAAVAHAATLPYSPVNEQDANAMLLHTAQATPGQLSDLLASVVPPELKAKLDKEGADTAKAKADADKAAAEAANLRAQGPVKHLEQKAVMFNGKPADAVFDPATGKTTINGQDVTGKTTPIPPASTVVNTGALNDVKETVAGMKDGTLPPMMPGRATKEYLATMAEAHRQGYDLQAAVTDWNATQKHISTMNGNQQLKLNQAINALPEMLDKVDALAAQWKGGRFPLLNKANLSLAKNGVYGPDVASVANQLDAQIADVTADLGNVYMGGNSPTDHALGLAAKSLSGSWSEKVLHDMTNLARNNVQIRSNSIKHTGVAGASPTNPYAPPSASLVPAGAGSTTPASDPLGLFK